MGGSRCQKGKIDAKNLRMVLKDIIPLIRFPLFSVNELSVYVTPLNILSQGELLQLYTYIACKDSGKFAELPQLMWSCERRKSPSLSFVWSRCGTYGLISSSGQKLQSTGGGGSYCCALGSEVIAPKTGMHYFEIRIEMPSVAAWQVAVGVAQETIPLDQYLGASGNSWCYYNNSLRMHVSGLTNERYGQPYGNGDVIGVLLDSDKGELFFYHNGAPMGLCFGDISEKVWPAVQVSAGAAITNQPNASLPAK